jgi:hypothetical protein
VTLIDSIFCRHTDENRYPAGVNPHLRSRLP